MSLMDRICGEKKTSKDVLRRYKRSLNRTIRELDRERQKMQNQERKLIREMKMLAKKNQMDAVKIIAKDLVRTRAQVKKFYKMKAQMQAVSLKLTTMATTQKMAKAMKGVAVTMRAMNSSMNLPQIQKVMKQFAKQNGLFDMKEEMMGDMLDDAMAESDEEEETDQLVNSVLDEIGIDLQGKIDNLGGMNRLGQKQANAQPAGEDDLEARLSQLRGK